MRSVGASSIEKFFPGFSLSFEFVVRALGFEFVRLSWLKVCTRSEQHCIIIVILLTSFILWDYPGV